MAWMFAGTEQDLMVGVHFHQHKKVFPPVVPVPPFYVPMQPSFHPSLGPLRDKLAGTVKVDGRKAAKTGTKAKILLPPHLPVVYFLGVGPMEHIMPKENTGIDQIFMGAGIGAHPFGGIGFVVVEGKPAAGMLSIALGCQCIGGFDVMLPIPAWGIANALLIPTRGVSVLYGPAPLAIDLVVLAVAALQSLVDYLCNKIKNPWLKDLAQAAGNALVAGVEDFAACRFERDPPMSTADALAHAGRTAAYTFVDQAVSAVIKRGVGSAFKAIGGKIPDNAILKFGWDKAKGELQKKATSALKDLAFSGVDSLTGGDFNKWKKEQKAAAEAGKATAPDPLEKITSPLEKVAEFANEKAGDLTKQLDEKSKEAQKAQEAQSKALRDRESALADRDAALRRGDAAAAREAQERADAHQREADKAAEQRDAAVNSRFGNERVTREIDKRTGTQASAGSTETSRAYDQQRQTLADLRDYDQRQHEEKQRREYVESGQASRDALARLDAAAEERDRRDAAQAQASRDALARLEQMQGPTDPPPRTSPGPSTPPVSSSDASSQATARLGQQDQHEDEVAQSLAELRQMERERVARESAPPSDEVSESLAELQQMERERVAREQAGA
jgi:hypothetical protein